jgi:electron transfer flavoprotein alpha subunit
MDPNTPLRRDPRRPYVITSEGVRRIVLGTTADGVAVASSHVGAQLASPHGGADLASSHRDTHLASPHDGAHPAASGAGVGHGSTSAPGSPHSGVRAHAGASPAKPLRSMEPPQDYILVIAFSERGVLDEHPRQVVTAAALLAHSQTAVVVAVLGELNEDLAPYGADIVVVLPDCHLRQFRPEHTLSRLSGPLKRYPPSHVLLPERTNGEGDLGRRIAAAYGASVATHVVEISPEHVATYQLAQNATGRPSKRLARRALPDVILLEPNIVDTRLPFVGAGQRIDDDAFARHTAESTASSANDAIATQSTEISRSLEDDTFAVQTAESSASSANDTIAVQSAEAPRSSADDALAAQTDEAVAPSTYRDGGLQALEASDLPLEEADLITSAGNGVADVPLFLRLAKALGAATGASRVAVDDGRFARDKQIGATGKTVSANAYIAIGISGAVQHLQGIKDCRHVIAINRDIAAPIIQRADLSVIGDAQGIMQALLEAVETARSNRTDDAAGDGSGVPRAGGNSNDGDTNTGDGTGQNKSRERAA